MKTTDAERIAQWTVTAWRTAATGEMPADLEPVVVKRTDNAEGHYCFHNRYVLNEREHVVTCDICKCTIDPFWLLQEYAKHERNFRHRDQSLIREQKQLAMRVDDLKRQIRNLDAKVKRRSKKS